MRILGRAVALTAPSRELLKEDNHFKWYAAHEKSFN